MPRTGEGRSQCLTSYGKLRSVSKNTVAVLFFFFFDKKQHYISSRLLLELVQSLSLQGSVLPEEDTDCREQCNGIHSAFHFLLYLHPAGRPLLDYLQ